jgi:hypothetical protein
MFNEAALEKHARICKDVFVNKRKAFDSKEKRIVNQDQIEIERNNNARKSRA